MSSKESGGLFSLEMVLLCCTSGDLHVVCWCTGANSCPMPNRNDSILPQGPPGPSRQHGDTLGKQLKKGSNAKQREEEGIKYSEKQQREYHSQRRRRKCSWKRVYSLQPMKCSMINVSWSNYCQWRTQSGVSLSRWAADHGKPILSREQVWAGKTIRKQLWWN